LPLWSIVTVGATLSTHTSRLVELELPASSVARIVTE
jgi:hypothetical protein